MHTEGEHVKGPDPVVLAASAPGVLEGALRLRRPVACLVPVPKPVPLFHPMHIFRRDGKLVLPQQPTGVKPGCL